MATDDLTELQARVRALSPDERSYALFWLAAAGPDCPDGHAVVRALDEVEQRRRWSVLVAANGAGAVTT